MTGDDLTAALDATWPAASLRRLGPWMIRDGAGGGKRVSAATIAAPWTGADIALAADAMRAMGQAPLFMIREAEGDLDAALADLGYDIVDPVVTYAAPARTLAAPHDRHSYAHWPPLAIARHIWAEGGVGPQRIKVMDRAAHKAAILVRSGDRPAGVCFVALAGKTAMIHALQVAPAHRRAGAAQLAMAAAAHWAGEADTISLAVTAANAPARALYHKIGMQVVGQYHYRALSQ